MNMYIYLFRLYKYYETNKTDIYILYIALYIYQEYINKLSV